MRFLIVCFTMLVAVGTAKAQDIITFRDGKQVEANIIEITQTEIKYKKFRNPDGPLYTIGKHQVETITYSYGEIEEYGDVDVESAALTNVSMQIEPTFIEPVASENNARMIADINRPASFNKTKKVRNRHHRYAVVQYSLTSESLISSTDAEAQFRPTADEYGRLIYNLAIKNNCTQTIYVDLASSFVISSKGDSKSFFSNETITVSTSESSGGSFRLGALTNALGIGGIVGTLANGVSVGSGSSNDMTKTYQQQRVVVVPPKCSEYISQYKTDRGHVISSGESFYPGDISTVIRENEEGNSIAIHPYVNEVLEFDASSTPYYVDYVITYSSDPEFKTYSVLKFRFYISQVFGGHREHISNGKIMGVSEVTYTIVY